MEFGIPGIPQAAAGIEKADSESDFVHGCLLEIVGEDKKLCRRYLSDLTQPGGGASLLQRIEWPTGNCGGGIPGCTTRLDSHAAVPGIPQRQLGGTQFSADSRFGRRAHDLLDLGSGHRTPTK